MAAVSIPKQQLPLPYPYIVVGDESNANAPSSSLASSSSELAAREPSYVPKLPLRKFVWGDTVIRNALPHPIIPPWLDPLDVDVDDVKKLPLCWYGVPFLSDLVFAHSQRVKVALYMKHRNLSLKPGDFDAYGTWPRLVKWFEDKCGLTMHLNEVWGRPTHILTFFNNHQIPHVTREMWELVGDLLDDMGYPPDLELKWYLDRQLEY